MGRISAGFEHGVQWYASPSAVDEELEVRRDLNHDTIEMVESAVHLPMHSMCRC